MNYADYAGNFYTPDNLHEKCASSMLFFQLTKIPLGALFFPFELIFARALASVSEVVLSLTLAIFFRNN